MVPCDSGHHAERPIERVGDALRRFHVPRHHRRRKLRPQHRALRDGHFERFEATGVERDIRIDQRTKYVEHRRHAHRRGCVEVVRELRRCSGKVDARRAPAPVDRDRHLDHAAVVDRVGELARRAARRSLAGPPPRHCPAHAACRRARRRARSARPSCASSCTPFSFAAIMAREVGHVLFDVPRRVAARRRGARRSRPRAIAPPPPAGSCRSARPPRRQSCESGGIEPGVNPPMSA